MLAHAVVVVEHLGMGSHVELVVILCVLSESHCAFLIHDSPDFDHISGLQAHFSILDHLYFLL